MNGLIPPGARVILIGSAASINDLNTFAPMEEGMAEGSLMLMRLDFASFPTSDALAELEKKLQNAGVRTWPGNSFVVYGDTNTPSVYLAWQKGIAWMSIIIGILVVTLLPVLLGGLVWLILPQSIKDLLTGLVGMGMMLLVIWLMTSLMKPLLQPEKEKLRKLKRPEEKPEVTAV